MNGNALAFLLKYSSPYSILVVTYENKLIELKCPFKAKVIKNIKNLMSSEEKLVTQVKLATNNKLVYVIENTPYYYNYFDIVI